MINGFHLGYCRVLWGSAELGTPRILGGPGPQEPMVSGLGIGAKGLAAVHGSDLPRAGPDGFLLFCFFCSDQRRSPGTVWPKRSHLELASSVGHAILQFCL